MPHHMHYLCCKPSISFRYLQSSNRKPKFLFVAHNRLWCFYRANSSNSLLLYTTANALPRSQVCSYVQALAASDNAVITLEETLTDTAEASACKRQQRHEFTIYFISCLLVFYLAKDGIGTFTPPPDKQLRELVACCPRNTLLFNRTEHDTGRHEDLSV
eukprot:1493722-Amphidinium_carterae.2